MPASKKIVVTVAGNTLTATNGTSTRSSIFASASAAKALASKLSRDVNFAARWMKISEPVQLDLPFGSVEESPTNPS